VSDLGSEAFFAAVTAALQQLEEAVGPATFVFSGHGKSFNLKRTAFGLRVECSSVFLQSLASEEREQAHLDSLVPKEVQLRLTERWARTGLLRDLDGSERAARAVDLENTFGHLYDGMLPAAQAAMERLREKQPLGPPAAPDNSHEHGTMNPAQTNDVVPVTTEGEAT
jgi:hypothetical protein